MGGRVAHFSSVGYRDRISDVEIRCHRVRASEILYCPDTVNIWYRRERVEEIQYWAIKVAAIRWCGANPILQKLCYRIEHHKDGTAES